MTVERRRLVCVLVFSLAVVALAYANSLPNDFILDDSLLVGLNPAIRIIAPIQNLLTPFWGEKSQLGIYRPLVLFSTALKLQCPVFLNVVTAHADSRADSDRDVLWKRPE